MLYFAAKLRQVLRNNQFILALLAVAIGIIAGLSAILFHSAIDFFDFLFRLGVPDLKLIPKWQIFLMPVVGGLFIGLGIHYFFPEKRPQNVADVIEASAIHGGKMKLRTGMKAALASAVSIGSGASVGQEGPIVHLGSTLASWCAQLFNLPATLTRTILGCGIAGAVAAAFNAPIAGVFFALEVVIGHYALSAFTPVVLAAVTATMVSRWRYGDDASFTIAEQLQVVSPFELPLFVILGVICAFVALVLGKMIFAVEDAHEKFKVPVYFRPIIGGAIVGLIAIWLPEVMGVGYKTTTQALNGQLAFGFLAAVLVFKMIATSVSLGSSFSGGIFSPSIFIGAVLGGFFGVTLQQVVGLHISDPAVYAVLGMGAVAGAIMGAPISTILIVFELTGNYAVTIALMVATGVAATVLAELKVRSFFQTQLRKRGLKVDSGRYTGLMRSIRVSQLLSKDMIVVNKDVKEATLTKTLVKARLGQVWVVDGQNKLLGGINIADMASVMSNISLEDLPLKVEKIINRDFTYVTMDDHLRAALNQQEISGRTVTPIVNNKDEMILQGVLYTRDLLNCYQREIQRARAAERGDPVPPPLYQ